MKKILMNILIISFTLILGIGTTSTLAMQDYQGNKAKTLRLAYFRYVNGAYTDGYALNTVGNEGESHHPIYQIMNESNNTNYFCLNATAGESWLSGTIGASATYNRSYDLNSQADINTLQADNSLSQTYRNVVNSKYLKQILWILDNMYVSDQASNVNQKQELLAKAGIVYGDVDDENLEGNVSKGYKYVAQDGYDYSSKVSKQGKKGYFYYDTNGQYHSIELTDELIEVAEQTALWYFTNYLDNNSQNSQTYNVKDQWLPLLCSNGIENTNTNQWKSLESETFYKDTDVGDVKAEVGKWKQEQAAIVCQYLIDAANKYAANSNSEITGNPLKITPVQPNISQKSVSGTEYYVVGPIKIDELRTVVYSLDNNIYVNNSTETGAYISSENGNRNSEQTLSSYIGKEFYISIPKTKVTENNIKIGFDGTYKTNQKTLWISTTKTEQPIVEVTPKNEQFELEVNTELTKITVTKIWNDYSNKENTRKNYGITLTGKVGSQVVYTNEVNLEPSVTTYTWTGLAKYKNGQEITYSVDETTVPEKYTKTINGYTITNKYETTTQISGTKTWKDYNNKENTRPNKIRIYLVKNGTKTNTYKDVTANDGWKYTFQNLEKYDENNNIFSYSVEEEKIDNYTTTYDGNNIINTYTAKTKISGTKTWIDYENKDNTRPNKIRIYLVKNGTKTNTYKDITEADRWKYSFEDLEKYDENNNLISYSVEEEKVNNYTTTYDGNNITNKYIAKTKVEGTKTWIDNENKYNSRPDKIRVYLVKNGKKTNTYKDVTEADGWKYSFEDLEKYDENNNLILYSVEEDEVENYSTTYDGNNIVNKYKPTDLALTKFITAISEDTKIEDGEYLTSDGKIGSETNPYIRATKVDTKELRDNENCHDATYIMVKEPLTIPEQSYVLYNIRVYNEGETDVYAGEIKDYLPNYLDYVDGDFNKAYGWKVGTDGKTVTTSYLSYNQNDKEAKNLLKAFDKTKDNGEGSGLDYRDVQILCRVNSNAPEATNLINSAEITKYQNREGKDISEDIDSKPDNLKEKNKEHREEDDDDYEVINIKKKKVDLALTKFITAISNDTKIEDGEYLTADGKVGSKENPYTRATKVNTKELRDDEKCHDATYVMIKNPLTVPAKSYVLYNIRVYNEGETDVYAGEITDHLPEYLDYVDCEFNTKYGWQVESDGKTIKSVYLGYNPSDRNATNLLKAFNKKTDDGEGSGLDYRDIQVLCRVNEKAPSNTNIVNVAEITKYQKITGEDIPEDIDSTPNNVDKKNEDDDDYEVINVKTFDLSLLKYVSKVYVTEDGTTKVTETGNTGDDKKDIIPKVEINKKKLNSTVVKFGYTIKITNEGDIAGYAKEITDYVPEGLQFYGEDNEGWTDEGNNVISTRLLENTLLQPGESAEVTVILRWINRSNNLGLKTNTAEISEDFNDWGVPDRDSTPDNKVPGEDDIDDASVLLSISTGALGHIAMYIIYGATILIVLITGIKLIKKHVL